MVERSRTTTPHAGTPTPAASTRREDTGDAEPATADRKAVALSYKPETADSAPVVTASGRGHLAERILEAAREAGVPVHRDADLIEILAATDVGDEIPVEAFIAVAEVLRYVYQANGQAAPIPTRSTPADGSRK
ncbi:EscU/YscU/HrcU family type III secretion system export apparatus switch protein [Marivibrio halodurans]|uniref:EscU/YscU/HrcU family type III secretion system export apparatus switch protein n=1 Tax=Marivibrio halodurans TaxID=2039722 RepID=A0A8J7SMK5_9PROT|nr:EscU/YscU/HrcU family type III secretion system export apparatus switch protein [Marivibrio halodurans]MBP5857016.1 EscU/YscU/HrcU family type III secretion system export apparatus switch protein [Marivibrio halodurans]